VNRFLKWAALASGVLILVVVMTQADWSLLSGLGLSEFWIILFAIVLTALRSLSGTYGLVTLLRSRTKDSSLKVLNQLIQASVINLSVPFLGFALKARNLKMSDGMPYKISIQMLGTFTGVRILSSGTVLFSFLLSAQVGNLGPLFFIAPLLLLLFWGIIFFLRRVFSGSAVGDYNQGRFILLSIWDIITMLLSGGVVGLLALSLGNGLTISEAMTASSAAMIASSVPLLPGGLGLRELALMASLSVTGEFLGWLAALALMERIVGILGRFLALISLSLISRFVSQGET
jgi:uncharacterized membrane protein YbhN (UPF0104 family)